MKTEKRLTNGRTYCIYKDMYSMCAVFVPENAYTHRYRFEEIHRNPWMRKNG